MCFLKRVRVARCSGQGPEKTIFLSLVSYLFLNAHPTIKHSTFWLKKITNENPPHCFATDIMYAFFSITSPAPVVFFKTGNSLKQVFFKGSNFKVSLHFSKLKLRSRRMGITSTTTSQLTAARCCSCLFNLFESSDPWTAL